MKKTYLKQLLAAILLLCSTVVSAETLSGTCGENVTWSLDTETGVLNISGTGEMTDYTSSSSPSWYSHQESIASVTICDGITNIGKYAFYNCTNLTSVTIGNGVTSIGILAFKGCNSLTSIVVDEENSVYDSREGCNAIIETATNTLVVGCKNSTIPNSVTSIGNYAFYGCSVLTSITIPNSVTSIGEDAFWNCYDLTDIYFASNPTIGFLAISSSVT